MSGTYSTGPALFFAGVGPNFAPLFIGCSEGQPEPTWDADWENVMNDIGGTKKPIDRQYMGEEVSWSVVFSKYNESVLRLIQARTYRATAARGVQPFGSMGAFMALEGNSFPLWVRFPYISKPAMVALGMPAGMRFPVCFSMGEKAPVGTMYRKVHVQFQCQRLLVIMGNAPGWLLYDEDMSRVANLPIN